MAKNYADMYNYPGDTIALDQRFYAKLEASPGTLQAPGNADFFYTLGGGSITFSQPFDPSPHRSGRHNLNIIKKKKVCTWSFSTYVNIDQTQVSASLTEVDTGIKLLFKSLLGKEDDTGGSPVFNASVPPSLTFTLMEVGDRWARQARACFVEACTMAFPGNGEATLAWSGSAADSLYVGIGKSVTANASNTVTLATGEGDLFPVGAMVMVVKSNGTTRSSDTPLGTPRHVLSVSGDVVTLSGANLTDSDGTTNPVYLCYYEPTTPAAIDNPVTGLVGSFAVSDLDVDCLRQGTVTITNNHELVNYCYGKDALDEPYFVPGARVSITFSMELNLNKELGRFFNRITNFEAQDMTIILGSSTGRHLQVTLPKIYYPVPAFTLPETGSVPVTFAGTAFETALDAADEISVSYL